jgi:hypothetical protein
MHQISWYRRKRRLWPAKIRGFLRLYLTGTGIGLVLGLGRDERALRGPAAGNSP